VTIAAVRIGLVAALLAAVWHAVVPGMPFGAWMVIFLAVNAFAWPFKLVGHALRRATDRVRGPSGFVRRSRVHPPL
jgi:fatty acid desaturase